MAELWPWIAFNALIVVLLAVDLGVFHREAHTVRPREAASWSAVWITLGLLFGLVVYFTRGAQPALEYLTGYLIEKSLSVDNIFVFVLIFNYFQTPARFQHRVLFWGIIGALLMRGAMIGAGAFLLLRFHWVLYVFGALLLWAGFRIVRGHVSVEPENNRVLRFVRRTIPVTKGYRGQKLVIRRPRTRTWAVTPLFVTLIAIETTDLVFALDSIPAVFAVTRDPFLVYTSNVFAILGLRALYFLLAGAVVRLKYLNYGLGAVLIFVGLKMLAEDFVQVPIGVSLLVVGGLITLSVVASLLRREPPTPE